MDINIENKTENYSELACELSIKNYSHAEVMSVLKNGSVIEKQACILKLNQLTSQDDADILVQHLTGQDGRIREVSAFKISELIKTHADYFQKQEIILTFLKGITDVNPTVCRFIIDALLFINDKKIVIDYLLEQTRQLFISINKAEKGVKKHILNKQIFKLYWSLEALVAYLYKENKFVAISDIQDILDEGVNFEEYTIREKIHKLLYCFKSNDCEKYIKKLENDENFYVRIGGRKRELE